MSIFLGAPTAIHSTVWLIAVNPLSISLLLKVLAAFVFVALLSSISSREHNGSLTPDARLFSAFMDNLPAFAWIKDIEGRYIYVNKLTLARLPPFRGDWLGKTDSDLWPGEIGVTYRANDLKVVTSRETLEMIETCLLDGEQHYLLVSKFPILDHTGAVTMVGATAADITAHQRAEDALREAEKKYRDIFENAVEGIFQTTPDGHFITANPALARILGYDSIEELLSSRTDIAQQHYVDPALRLEFKEMLEEDGVMRNVEHLAYRKDGRMIWLSENVRSVCDAQGRVLYYEGFTEDITARKRSDEALGLFRNLIDQSNDAIEILDPQTLRFLDCNTTAHQTLGYTREEFLSLTAFDIDPIIDEPMLARLRKAMDKSAFTIFESVHRRKDGSTFPVEINLKIIRLERDYRLAVVRDITERKRAEAELRESEERYRDLVENSHEFICTHDLDGKILSANRSAVQLLGYDPKELIGKRNIRDILAPQVRNQFDDYMAQILKEGATSGMMLVQTSSGEHRVWEYYNSLRTEGVKAPIVRGIARDVTEQRRAEKVMSDLRHELELTMNSMEEGIHRVDLTRNIVFENPAAARMLGWEVAELLGKPAHQTMHHTRPDGTPYSKDECPIYDTLRDGITRHVTDEVFWRRDGTSFPVEYMTAPMRNDRNEIVATVVTFQDITERKRAEAALRESEERYRELFENAKDTIYVHDLRGIYTSVNRAAEQLTGYSREEIIGKHFSDFLAPEYLPRVRDHLGKKLTEQRPTSVEVEVIARDGRRVPVELSSNVVCENGVPVGVQGIARDITERKRAEELLQTFPRRLIEAQEVERKRIARELHDEIGQVLTAISLNLQAVRAAGLTPTSAPKIDESILVVDDALHHVQNLALELRPSLLDDLGLAAAIRWFVDRYAQRTGIKTEIVTDAQIAEGRLPRELETACFRIVQEALTNVARHAEAKTVSIHFRALGDEICISIRDDGVGFDASAGNGANPIRLGLRGMEERALALGGKLEIKSTPVTGTEILAYFPSEKNRD